MFRGNVFRKLGRAAAALLLSSTINGGASAPPPSVTVTLPPANYDADDATTRTMGRVGGHLALHYFTLGTTHYVWFRQGDASPDPGADLGSGSALVAGLSGLTGIRVDLPASSQTDVQVAAAVASAIDAVSGLSASSSGADVTVVGVATAAAGSTSWSASVREGIIGTPDDRVLALNSFAADTLRASLLDSSDWGDVPIVLTGFSLAVGDTHLAGIPLAIYQGGSADNNYSGATLLGHLGTTAGDGSTFAWAHVQSSGIYVDPALGRVWVAFMHDTGQAEMSFTWYSQGSSTGNNYITVSNNAVHLMTAGPASSDPADFPSTLGTVASSEIGMLGLRLAFVDAASFQNDMRPSFDFGTFAGLAVGSRDTTYTFTSTTDDALAVANSFTVPSSLRGLELLRFGINYFAHVSGSDYCGHIGVGGAAVDDWAGATIYEVGQTSGTATGWNYVSAPSGIPLAAGSRIWLLLEYDGEPDPGPRTGIAFDAGASNLYEDEHWGAAAWYNGNTSESEYAPLSNPIVSPGQETTNLDFDPASDGLQPANSAPGPWVVTPNGFNFQNSNNVGVHGTAVTVGFAVAS